MTKISSRNAWKVSYVRPRRVESIGRSNVAGALQRSKSITVTVAALGRGTTLFSFVVGVQSHLPVATLQVRAENHLVPENVFRVSSILSSGSDPF
jgi:hypothetical protein